MMTPREGELPAVARDRLSDWEAVGRLNTRGVSRLGMCSAALIAPDTLLTAAHCVAGPDGNPTAPEMLHFAAGWYGGDHAADSPVASYEVHPQAYAQVQLDVEHDIALVYLAEPITEVTPLKIGSTFAPPYALAGYHDHRPHRLSARFDCDGRPVHQLLFVDCPVRPGNSGGPALSGGPDWQVIGVVSASARGNALVVPVDEWVRGRLLQGAPYTSE
nr:serine protease [Salipiger bermudensis]